MELLYPCTFLFWADFDESEDVELFILHGWEITVHIITIDKLLAPVMNASRLPLEDITANVRTANAIWSIFEIFVIFCSSSQMQANSVEFEGCCRLERWQPNDFYSDCAPANNLSFASLLHPLGWPQSRQVTGLMVCGGQTVKQRYRSHRSETFDAIRLRQCSNGLRLLAVFGWWQLQSTNPSQRSGNSSFVIDEWPFI